MDSAGTVREELDALSLPAGPSGVMVVEGLRHCTATVDLLRKQREVDARKEECKQVLESLKQRRDYMYKKEKDADEAAEKVERERKEVLQKEAETKRLKVEHAELGKRKQELQRQVLRFSVYRDYMEQAVKMTKFVDVHSLTGHLENLLNLRDKLRLRESESQEQADRQRKALLTLNDQQRLMWVHTNTQLSQLQTELERTCSEDLTWEQKWKHIQETAAKKTLLVGQIKLASLNLYETMDDMVKEEECVDMNDTEKQLDKIKMFIQDHSDIMKWHQASLQRQKDGRKRKDKPKKSGATHCKND